MIAVSRGKAFGSRRSPLEWLSLFGLLLWGNVWLLTIYKKGRCGYWIGVICASVFVWIAALGKCLTIDNLQKRKVWILDWCYMCECCLHCPVAMDLWSMVLGLFGVSWVMPKSVVGLLACWQSRFGRYWNGYIWIIIPHCLMWCLWRERNNSCFEDSERSISDLKLFFFRTFLDWLFALRNQSFSSIFDFSWFLL